MNNYKLSLIFLGDSLMQENDETTAPQHGWPQSFIEVNGLNKDLVKYKNYAKNGRSTKSFIDEGRFIKAIKELDESLNNYCFISFGHNDEKDDPLRHTSYPEYKENLKFFIEEMRKRNVKVILLTSITRLKYDENNNLMKTHLGYPQAMKEVAIEENIPLIDLETLTYNDLSKNDYNFNKDYYMIFDKNIYSNYMDGKTDTTHLSKKGSMWICNLIKTKMEFDENFKLRLK